MPDQPDHGDGAGRPRRSELRRSAVQGVIAGTEARELLRGAALRAGADPDRVLKAVNALTEPGKVILHLLGLNPDDVYFPHRPPDALRAEVIRDVVEQVADWINPETGREYGLSEAFKLAPPLLNDLESRRRAGIRTHEIPVPGKNGRLMAPASVRRAYKRLQPTLISLRWFVDPDDQAEPAEHRSLEWGSADEN